MNKRSRSRKARLVLAVGRGGSSYDIEPIYRLETMLAKKPRYLQLDLVGSRELSADCALPIRSILVQRSGEPHLTTHARSSLQGGSVLVWLQGDTRMIRDDARLHFRAAVPPKSGGEDIPPPAQHIGFRSGMHHPLGRPALTIFRCLGPSAGRNWAGGDSPETCVHRPGARVGRVFPAAGRSRRGAWFCGARSGAGRHARAPTTPTIPSGGLPEGSSGGS